MKFLSRFFLIFIITSIILTGLTVTSFAEGQGKGNDSGKGNPSQGFVACENSNENGKAKQKNPHSVADDDTIPNYQDLCPNENALGFDTDLDGCIDDTDNDSIYDNVDECPLTPGVLEFNGCPIPDQDSDGILDFDDNCIDIYNPNQIDTDNDGIGDVCDATPNGDDDTDGIDNLTDNCPSIPNTDQLDTDNDGIGDVCDDTPTGDIGADISYTTDRSITFNLVGKTQGIFIFNAGPETAEDVFVTFTPSTNNVVLLPTTGCIEIGDSFQCVAGNSQQKMGAGFFYSRTINFYAEAPFDEFGDAVIDVTINSSTLDNDLTNNSGLLLIRIFPNTLPSAPQPEYPSIIS